MCLTWGELHPESPWWDGAGALPLEAGGDHLGVSSLWGPPSFPCLPGSLPLPLPEHRRRSFLGGSPPPGPVRSRDTLQAACLSLSPAGLGWGLRLAGWLPPSLPPVGLSAPRWGCQAAFVCSRRCPLRTTVGPEQPIKPFGAQGWSRGDGDSPSPASLPACQDDPPGRVSAACSAAPAAPAAVPRHGRLPPHQVLPAHPARLRPPALQGGGR